MTDFTPTPEAVEAVEQVLYDASPEMTRAAIAAFVEAEELTTEQRQPVPLVATALPVAERLRLGLINEPQRRLVGPWRKRD